MFAVSGITAALPQVESRAAEFGSHASLPILWYLEQKRGALPAEGRKKSHFLGCHWGDEAIKTPISSSKVDP